MTKVARVRFTDYPTSVAKALDAIAAGERLPKDGLIIIKPNLVNDSPPPVTTPVAAAEAVYRYCRGHTDAEIVIGEGCGQGRTTDLFKKHGYAALAARTGMQLIDFNAAPDERLVRDDALQLGELYLPMIVRDAFIISLPVLKDHSMTVTTLAMKNMFGLAPAKRYRGAWNKSKLHSPSTHRSVVDVCLYKPPGLCVIDASVGLKGAHLFGDPIACGLILASFDPVAVDAMGSRLLGHDPKRIEYLSLANGRLGSMNGLRIVGEA